nr:integrase, catalytic region, zinc finger, CCHC-type, peptidase aspartic, catalytic [Tanacetum cinerariifolium]
AHLYADYKKSKDELKRRNTVEYATKMKLTCAKLRGELLTNEMERKRYSEKDTHDSDEVIRLEKESRLRVLELQNKLFAHQDTISVLKQQKDAQIKLYKTREDKDIEKVIDLENKVKVLDNIVYKTGQSVQIMNMLNNKRRTSFVKPEYLKKAKQANPRLYDIGCYNENLALMLSPDSDEVIRLEKESRSKLSDLVRPFDYAKLNSLYDLFVPQRDQSSEQRFFSELTQQCKEKVKNDMSFKVNKSKDFCKEREQYFEIQDLKAQLQDKSIAIRIIPTTSVSRPQLKSNPKGDRVLHSNSHGKKLEVEEPRRNVKLLKNKMPVTACTDSLNPKTVNVKSISALSAKCVMIKKHDLCVSKSVAKPLRKTAASESIKKPRNNVRKLNERFGKIYKWTYIKFTPLGYMWKPKSKQANHMTGNLKLLINFVEKFLGTVKFGNDQIAPILGYGDLVQGAVMIKRVYYVEGLNHNLFSVGQFCDADLEVAFRKSTCFICDLKGNDLLKGSRGTNLYSITLQDTNSPNLICLMAKATSSQA